MFLDEIDENRGVDRDSALTKIGDQSHAERSRST